MIKKEIDWFLKYHEQPLPPNSLFSRTFKLPATEECVEFLLKNEHKQILYKIISAHANIIQEPNQELMADVQGKMTNEKIDSTIKNCTIIMSFL